VFRSANIPYNKKHGYKTSTCWLLIFSAFTKSLDEDTLHHSINKTDSSMPKTPSKVKIEPRNDRNTIGSRQ